MKSLLLIFVTVLLSSCSHYFYWPTREIIQTPDKFGIRYHEITIENERQPDLHGWMLLPRAEAKATVVFLHGNAGNISTHWLAGGWLTKHGFKVLVADYRGYGLSGGSKDIEGIHTDIQRMIDFAERDSVEKNQHPLFLFGQSIGATMALYTATLPRYRDVFNGVIADSPFSSYQKIAGEKLGNHWGTYLVSWLSYLLVRDDFSPLDKIATIKSPALLLSCGGDTVVPSSHVKVLCGAMKEKCMHLHNPRCSHISFLAQPEGREQMLRFMSSLIEPTTITAD